MQLSRLCFAFLFALVGFVENTAYSETSQEKYKRNAKLEQKFLLSKGFKSLLQLPAGAEDARGLFETVLTSDGSTHLFIKSYIYKAINKKQKLPSNVARVAFYYSKIDASGNVLVPIKSLPISTENFWSGCEKVIVNSDNSISIAFLGGSQPTTGVEIQGHLKLFLYDGRKNIYWKSF